MPRFRTNHILLPGYTESLAYTSPVSGRSIVAVRNVQNPQYQGEIIENRFNRAVTTFQAGEDREFVYLVFRSAFDFYLDLDKLDESKGNFRLASFKKLEGLTPDGVPHTYYEAAAYLNKKAVSFFLKKVEQYMRDRTETGKPKHASFLSNIGGIRAATLESFWQEPKAFPAGNQPLWWEVWLDRAENPVQQLNALKVLAEQNKFQVGQRYLLFPEHLIVMVRATSQQLAASILYTDRLAELREPKNTADFFTGLPIQEQGEWIADLVNRIEDFSANNAVSVCLLDTGVTRTNPIIQPFVPERNLDAIAPDWSRADTNRLGHGTPMAGLSLLGDLTEALASQAPIPVYHQLESIKIIEQNQPNDPELYGSVTQEAVARGEIINPDNKRIVCMAVTSDTHIHEGRPSSWSAAIDQLLFGTIEAPNNKTVFLVSSGNVFPDDRINYPLVNNDCSIEDPAQAFNAITVGAFTSKDQVDLQRHPGAAPLARMGAMAPCNTTSMNWDKEWSRKPDIVMEGGNGACWQDTHIDPDSLLLLSTAKGGIGRPLLTTFGDTSASTALAARLAAELYSNYPDYWPETIRALIIHSANWTPAMLGMSSLKTWTKEKQQELIKKVGYGVPDITKARFSANDSLTLIAERTLRPYKYEESRVKTDEFHFFELPWPAEVLQGLLNTSVKLVVTLSYFIEPNPGNRRYELAATYRSHGLRFKMIDRLESVDRFKERVSKAMRDEDDPYEREGGDDWILGEQVRNKGSIHKDIWEGEAADLAAKNKIAVYPVGGWWKSRKKLRRYDNEVRYSLIITIETPGVNTDIYTPVLNEITISIEV